MRLSNMLYLIYLFIWTAAVLLVGTGIVVGAIWLLGFTYIVVRQLFFTAVAVVKEFLK